MNKSAFAQVRLPCLCLVCSLMSPVFAWRVIVVTPHKALCYVFHFVSALHGARSFFSALDHIVIPVRPRPGPTKASALCLTHTYMCLRNILEETAKSLTKAGQINLLSRI